MVIAPATPIAANIDPGVPGATPSEASYEGAVLRDDNPSEVDHPEAPALEDSSLEEDTASSSGGGESQRFAGE